MKSTLLKIFELHHEKTGFLPMQKQKRRSASQITFVFATRIVQFLFFLNPKFQASSHLLCLHSSVCVGNHIVGFLMMLLIWAGSICSAKLSIKKLPQDMVCQFLSLTDHLQP